MVFWHSQPCQQRGHPIETIIPPTVRWTIGDRAEVRSHAPHDELRRLGGKSRVRPPAQTAFDVGIEFVGSTAVVLSEHPRAVESALELMPLILLHQRPRRRVDGIAGVERRGRLTVAHAQITTDVHLPKLVGGWRWRGEDARRGQPGADSGKQAWNAEVVHDGSLQMPHCCSFPWGLRRFTSASAKALPIGAMILAAPR